MNPLKTWSHSIIKHNQEHDWVCLTIIWDLALKFWYICTYIYVFMYVLFCFVMICADVLLVHFVHICMFVYVYIYVCASVHIYICVYICAGTHCICLKVICLSCRYRACYLLVWHCYLGSILAFSFEFQNLNTTICTKTSNKST